MAVVPGSWAGTVNRFTRQPRFSRQTCPVCRFPLHQILAEQGIPFHYLCDPRPVLPVRKAHR
jgi:hypothetical protein